MAYRTFFDWEGREWQAWDVLPKGVERRLVDRRMAAEQVAFADRRLGDRRKVTGRWTPLTSVLRDGWLCFESTSGRRRLTPIPSGWEECSEDALDAYCRSASPVRLSSPASRRA